MTSLTAALDETMTIEVEGDATEYVYSHVRGSSAAGLAWYEFGRTPRSWEELKDSKTVRLYYRDDLGQELPSSIGDADTLRLVYPQSGMRFEWPIVDFVGADPSPDWAGQPTKDYAAFTVTPPAETRGGENLPEDDEEARFSLIDSSASAATVTLWCRKRDLTMRDQIRADAGDLFEAERDAMFLTRWRDWKVGDVFTFRSEQWQVRSTAEIGRRRAVEIHARLCA